MSSHEPLPTFPGDGGESAARGPGAPGDYASWLLRAGAYLIDGFVLLALAYVGARIVGVHGLTAHLGKKQSTKVTHAFEVFFAIDYALIFLYATFLLSSRWRATLGMRLCNIHLEAADGSRLSVGRVVGRMAIVLAVSLLGLAGALGIVVSLALLVDVLWPLWDDRRQTLHDKVAGTVVRMGRAA